MHYTLIAPRSDTPKPCVFLDRDGTVNVDTNYLYRIEDWQWTPSAREAILQWNQAGFLVVIITNQSGIGRGYYTAQDVEKLHAWVQEELKPLGAHIDGFFFCDHVPETKCDCRKPSPAMLLKAAELLNIDLARSWMIGDKEIDAQAGKAAGVQTIRVEKDSGLAEAMHAISR